MRKHVACIRVGTDGLTDISGLNTSREETTCGM
jgi:hypothetical protein